MMGELVIRAALGGALVCLFSFLGEIFQPKTFSGLFGAAPSVAIASLALSYRSHGGDYVQAQGRSMIVGAIALLIYSAVCVAAVRRRGLPVWLSAGAAWGAWLIVALCAWRIGAQAGLFR